MFKLDFKTATFCAVATTRSRYRIEIAGWLIAAESASWAPILEGREPTPTLYTLETYGDTEKEAYDLAVLMASDINGTVLWQRGSVEFTARQEVWVMDAIHKALIGRRDRV
jgi:hypothetical protein